MVDRQYVDKAPRGGLCLEFGVASGSTIRWLAEWLHPRTVYGFDSWLGLPEDWRDDAGDLHQPRGAYACEVPTDLPRNVELVKGLFVDTLPTFLATHRGMIAFVHIDCDLYRSTKYVLEALRYRFADGAVIAFDEYEGCTAYEHHEKRAFAEFIPSSGFAAVQLTPGSQAHFKLRKTN